jgi:hypothetical protein
MAAVWGIVNLPAPACQPDRDEHRRQNDWTIKSRESVRSPSGLFGAQG